MAQKLMNGKQLLFSTNNQDSEFSFWSNICKNILSKVRVIVNWAGLPLFNAECIITGVQRLETGNERLYTSVTNCNIMHIDKENCKGYIHSKKEWIVALLGLHSLQGRVDCSLCGYLCVGLRKLTSSFTFISPSTREKSHSMSSSLGCK